MKEFSIPLLSKYERPIIELYKLPTLIDTGALIPVVSMFPVLLEKYFDFKIILPKEFVAGFGTGAVYSLAEFKVGELTFTGFEVFVPEEPRLKFPFLLSATLFHGMAYEVDTINQKFTVRMQDDQPLERDFKIREIRGELLPQIDGVLIQDADIFLKPYIFF